MKNQFKRNFSVNYYKSLNIPLGAMSFNKDWTSVHTGDPYPAVNIDDKIFEHAENGKYCLSNRYDTTQKLVRFVGNYFPYASYYIGVTTSKNSKAGFSFYCKENLQMQTDIYIGDNNGDKYIEWSLNMADKKINGSEKLNFNHITALIITCREDAFDIYIKTDTGITFVKKLECNELDNMLYEKNYSSCDVRLTAQLLPGGIFETTEVKWYIDCGISQADIRPIKYEDGTPIIENGRIFLSLSSRNQSNTYQTIFSWNPSLCDFQMEGALFYDCGDGKCCGDVAASIVYDRNSGKWLIWYCSFSHGHILAHASTESDPRFGVTVLDTFLMPSNSDSLDSDFFAKSGDEDPDIIFDKNKNRWLMSICRLTDDCGSLKYRYFFFESDSPFENFRYIGNTVSGENTGGSFISANNSLFFVCGSDFDKKSKYCKYNINNLSDYEELEFDYPDGGFRGWGSVFAYKKGNRTNYKLITFDRHNGSEYNWSYGNIYVFTSDYI